MLYKHFMPDRLDPDKESVILYDMSPELFEELKRRAQASGNDPATEAERIIEDHVRRTSGESS